MGKRLILFDQHHPDSPLEAEVEHSSPTELSLVIPKTQVRFALRRRDEDSFFEGSLGSREFMFDPSKPALAALFENAL